MGAVSLGGGAEFFSTIFEIRAPLGHEPHDRRTRYRRSSAGKA